MRIDTVKHGSNQIGQTYYGERCWKRRDTYTPKDGRQAITESRFAASAKDTSPLFIDGETGHYDSRCSCCFLGFSHTVDAHNERTERAPRGQTVCEPCLKGQHSECIGPARCTCFRANSLHCPEMGKA